MGWMVGEAERLREELDRRLLRRGWRFREQGEVVKGRAQEWPHQLELIVDPGGPERVPCLGIAINFDAMPLGGERFRDILNADREELLFSYGPFRVRQQNGDGNWIAEIGHRAFVHGYGSGSGISRRTTLAVFDRCPTERGLELADRVVADLSRLAETGAAFAAALQRVYQRTVLSGSDDRVRLPDVIAASASLRALQAAPAYVGAEAPYPWRR